MPFSFFFFNDTATTEIYTLSLHDALPICPCPGPTYIAAPRYWPSCVPALADNPSERSEEHTSELQSQSNLVCRLLLEKKNFAVLRTLDYSGAGFDPSKQTAITQLGSGRNS